VLNNLISLKIIYKEIKYYIKKKKKKKKKKQKKKKKKKRKKKLKNYNFIYNN